jgi:hypothetical protein
VNGLAFTPDGKQLASGGGDGALCLWDLSTRKQLYRVAGHTAGMATLDVSRDGRTVATGGWDFTAAVWNTATGKEGSRIKGLGIAAISLAFAPAGRVLAYGGNDGTVLLLEPATGREVRRLVGHKGHVEFAGFTPDGRFVVSGASDKTMRLWSVDSGKQLYAVPCDAPVRRGIAMSADGRTLTARTDDGTLRAWEVATGKERAHFPLKEGVVALACSPDGRYLAGALTSLAVCVWDLATGREVCRYTGLAVWIMRLAFSPDGRTLAGGSADSTILLWDVGRVLGGQPLQAVKLNAAQLQQEWQALTGKDAARAYRALGTLAAAPRQALPLLRQHLRPAASVDAKRVEKLLAGLDDDDFVVRQKATRELEKLGEEAEASLRKVLQGNPSAEVRVRVKRLLEKMQGGLPSAGRCHRLRMVEVLERIGTPEARRVLEEAAGNRSDPWLAAEARQACRRLDQRGGAKP